MNALGTILSLAVRAHRRVLKALRGATVGVRAIVQRDDGAVLLVRHTYRPGWSLPGGGVDSGETPLDAVIRELREETGVTPTQAPQFFGVYHNVYLGLDDYPIVYTVRTFTQQPTRSAEIAEVGWFSVDQLPLDTTPGSRRRIMEFAERSPRVDRW